MMKSLYLFIASFLCFSAFAAENTVDQTIQVQFLDGNKIVETIELPQSHINLCQTLKEQKQMEEFFDQQELIIPIHQLSPKNFKLIQEFFPTLLSNNQDQLIQDLAHKSDLELGSIAKTADYLSIETLFKNSLEVIENRIWNNLENYYTAYSSSHDPFNIDDHTVIASYIKTALIKKIQPFTFKEEALFIGHTNNITSSVVFSPNGTQLASASSDKTIKLWDIHSKTCLHTLTGHTKSIESVAFSPDGNYLASASWDRTLKLWDIHSKICLHTFVGHTDTVFSVAFSPDGTQLASASWDKTIKLWDIHSKTCLHTFTCPDEVLSVAFSPDGTQLASASWGKTISLWDIHSKTCLHTFAGHTGLIYSVAFNPNGTQLASGSRDGAIKLWDIESKTCLHTFAVHGPVYSVVFSPDGKHRAAAFGYKTIQLWKNNSDLMNASETLAQAVIISHLLKNIPKTEWLTIPGSVLKQLMPEQQKIIKPSPN